MWFFKKELGLDIGSRTLKALRLKKKGAKVVLDGFFFYDLAEGNEKFPTITNIGDSLKALVEINRFTNNNVVSCVDENDLATFDLVFPKMPDADLTLAIANEIEQNINFPIAEASIGHIVIASEEKLTVKAFCVRFEDMTKIVDVLERAELKTTSLEISMLSNIAMLDFNEYLDDDAYTVLIDLGETKTCTALLKGKKLIATNSIAISLGTINSRLRTTPELTYLDAEKIKNEVTLKLRENGPAQKIVETVYVELIKELQRGIEFFQLTTSELPIQKIFAIGGGSQYPSILSAIQASCGIDTVAANPFRKIEIFSKDETQTGKIGSLAPHMGTAVGLALRKLHAS